MTKLCSLQLNSNIEAKLLYLKNLGDEYWSFKAAYKRDHSHSYFRYPAMMVPQMIRKILDELCILDPTIQHIHDPFVGSGTTLTESILRGLAFTGRDINPLSILLCKVKSGPFHSKILQAKITILLERITLDTSSTIEVNFINLDKWFRKDIQIDLSKIRRAIQQEKSLWVRRFFWVALAETVRMVSNSRTTTYKLHIREYSQITTRNLNTIKVFAENLQSNYIHLKETQQYLKKLDLLSKGFYIKDIKLFLGDARKKLPIQNQYDLVLTSPPYGDNHTTVTYGQYSYLPLQWIDFKDIDKKASSSFLTSISSIDKLSLGGLNYQAKAFEEELAKISPTYQTYLKLFQNKPKPFLNKITSFFYDLNECLDPILDKLKNNGYLIWTLGNRTVCGISIQLDQILIELFQAKNIKLIDIIYRPIPNKRMANKNNSSQTISKETILILQKAI